MKKKIIFSIVIIAILIVLVAIAIVIKRTENSSTQTKVNYFIMHSNEYDQKSRIISNYKDFKEFVEKNNLEEKESLEKYNEAYFKNKSLAVAFITKTNSADSMSINEVVVNGNSLVIRYTNNKDTGSSIGMDVMSSTMVFAETDKNVKNIKLIKE